MSSYAQDNGVGTGSGGTSGGVVPGDQMEHVPVHRSPHHLELQAHQNVPNRLNKGIFAAKGELETRAGNGAGDERGSRALLTVDLDLDTDGAEKEGSVSQADITASRTEKKPHRWLGLLLIALSSFLLALQTLILSIYAQRVGSYEAMAFRTVMQLVLGALVGYFGYNVDPFAIKMKGSDGRNLLLMRGFFGCMALGSLYYALLSWIFLGERFGLFNACVTVVCLGGVVLVARPPFIFGDMGEKTSEARYATGKERYIAIAVVLMASFFSACVYVILRAIGSAKKIHFMQTVTYFGLVGTSVAWIPIAVTGVTVPTAEEFMGLSLMGLSAFVAQMMFCKGGTMEQAVTVSIVRNLDVVFAFVFQVGILHESVNTLSAIGATIVIAGCASIAVRKARQKPAADFAEIPSEGEDADDGDDIESSGKDRGGDHDGAAGKSLRADFEQQEDAAIGAVFSRNGGGSIEFAALSTRPTTIQSGSGLAQASNSSSRAASGSGSRSSRAASGSSSRSSRAASGSSSRNSRAASGSNSRSSRPASGASSRSSRAGSESADALLHDERSVSEASQDSPRAH